mmetsp:Transcript_11713/g.50185  ORF Transcript_11713/g.50185 Transcript_11713/m.50185 type:complete len:246 (+) Transcript_11713:828-1565(+)
MIIEDALPFFDTPGPCVSESSITVNRPLCTLDAVRAKPERSPTAASEVSSRRSFREPFSSSITVNLPLCSTDFSRSSAAFGLDLPELGPECVGDNGRDPGPARSLSGTAGSVGVGCLRCTLSPSLSSRRAASALSSSMLKFHMETPLTYSAWLFFSAAASVDAAPPRLPAATAAARSACRARSRSLSRAVRSPSGGMFSSRCFTKKSGFLASFRNLCSRSLAALGRLFGSFCKHTDTKSLKPRVK